MTTFRSTAAGSDEDEENSGASDDEKTVVERILMNRPKVIAKRRFPGKGPDANDGQDTVQVEAEPIETDEGKNGIQNSLPKVKPSNAGELWADTAIMQTLEEKIGSGSSSTIADLHDRGVETYARDLGPKPKHRPTAGRKRRRPDDISDSIWDEQMGEEESASGDQGKPSDSKEEQIETDAKVVVDPVVDLWEGVDTGAVELPIERQGRKHHNQWHPRGGRGGRGRGDHGHGHGHFKRFKQDQGQSQHWNREKRGDRSGSGSGSRGQSRNRQNAKEFVPVTQFLPRRLVAPDYDQKKLFETVLDPEALNEEQLVNTLVEALGEKQPTLISKLVEFTGKHLAVELFKECQEVEKRGGMLTKREDRRKTPGGVFMQLFNQREGISAEHKKALFALGSELMKQNNSSLWWNKKKSKKQQQEGTATNPESSPPPIIENEDLPRCSEIFKPNTDEEKQQEPSDATNSNGTEPMN